MPIIDVAGTNEIYVSLDNFGLYDITERGFSDFFAESADIFELYYRNTRARRNGRFYNSIKFNLSASQI